MTKNRVCLDADPHTVDKPHGVLSEGRNPSDSCSYRPALLIGRGVSALARKHSDSICRKRSPQASFFDTLRVCLDADPAVAFANQKGAPFARSACGFTKEIEIT